MAIVCPLCPTDACCHFKPASPDLYIKNSHEVGKMTVARFAHLNHLVDQICCISDVVASLQAGSIQSIIYCGAALPEVLGVVTIPDIVTDATLTGTGCIGDPLSVAPGASSIGYAEYVQHTQGSNVSVAPGSAIEYLTDNPLGVFNTLGITTTTGPGGQGTEFLLPIGVYMIDYENSADAAWSLAIYKSLATQTEVIDTNTIAGASTATTWIHGRAIINAAAPTYIIISPVVGTQAIPTAGTAAGEFIARLTILKIG